MHAPKSWPAFVMLLTSEMQARSSSQRKALFRSIQVRNDIPPVNLLLDMKVRWSLTYVMLHRASSRRQVSNLNCFFTALHLWLHQSVDEFILGLGIKEVNADKRRKISALVLSEEEWTRVRLFCNILQVRSTLTEVIDD